MSAGAAQSVLTPWDNPSLYETFDECTVLRSCCQVNPCSPASVRCSLSDSPHKQPPKVSLNPQVFELVMIAIHKQLMQLASVGVAKQVFVIQHAVR